MPELRIRPATPDDADRIARIWWLGWHDGHTGLVPEELLAFRTQESFVPRVTAAIPRTRVAEVDGEVIGFTMQKGDEVEQVFVDAAHRGTGVAAQLLADAAREVMAAGHAVPWLGVVTGNARAHRFYEREGWTDTGEVEYPATTGPDSHVIVSCHRMEWHRGHFDLPGEASDARRLDT